MRCMIDHHISNRLPSCDVAIIATDEHDKIVLLNPSAEKLFSCRHEAVMGGSINQLGLQHVISLDIKIVVEFELTHYRHHPRYH